jgi:hypothetical protein
MNLPQLQTLLQKLKPSNRAEFRTISEKASHDWKVMVLVFALLSLITIGGGLYMFVQIAKGKLFQGNNVQVAEIKKINQKDLDRVIEFFDTKKQVFDGLSDRVGVVEDPSL